MGLDMLLKKTQRPVFYSIDRADFWEIAFDNSEELIYWRKRFDIDNWFMENTTIKEEYSDELTKEKLEGFENWLIEKNLKDDAENIKDLIDKTDFTKDVIYYVQCP